MKIYLVRHGETEYNRTEKLQGQNDIPLNKNGIELAKKTSIGLQTIYFERVFSSPLQRAYKTAEIITGESKIPIETDDRLKEISFGSFEGISFSLIKKDPSHPLHNFFCKPESYIPPKDAESFGDVKKRSREFLNQCICPLEGKYENILIVAHACLIQCILNPILATPDNEFWKNKLPNCSVSILSLENGGFHVLERGKSFC